MDVRLKKEGTTPIVLCIKDSMAKSCSHQLPLRASTGLDDREGSRARIGPPPDPMGVRVAAGFKQGGTCIINISENSIGFYSITKEGTSRIGARSWQGKVMAQLSARSSLIAKLGSDSDMIEGMVEMGVHVYESAA